MRSSYTRSRSDSCGSDNVTQVRGNVAAASLAPLSDAQLSDLERVYDERIRAHVHDRW